MVVQYKYVHGFYHHHCNERDLNEFVGSQGLASSLHRAG